MMTANQNSGQIPEFPVPTMGSTMTMKTYGQQGDDVLYGHYGMLGKEYIHGGTGDDKVYGGRMVSGVMYLYGGAGKDVVRSDWWRQYDDMQEEASDQILFGDYRYGEDALDKDLWGDDDLIRGGYGDGGNAQSIYGGDGNDEIYAGYNWGDSYVFGENGDDIVYAPQLIGTTYLEIDLGAGDDEIRRVDWQTIDDESWENSHSYTFLHGRDGNDVIRAPHGDGEAYIYGGNGEDKIYGGDDSADL